MNATLTLHRAGRNRFATAALLSLLLASCTGGSGGVTGGSAPTGLTPTGASNACVRQAEVRMAQQQRIFREILVGRPSAERRPVNGAAYTEDGTPWIKTAANTWRSAAINAQGQTMTDATMNQRMEWELMNEVPAHPGPRSREGIVAAQGVTTSQIVHEMSQSYRALACRLAMVCAGITTVSTVGDAQSNVSVITPGCTELFMKPMEHCVASNDAVVGAASCWRGAEAILDREAALLRFAASYDASYRSLLQFSGNFDGFLANFRSDILQPLEQTLSILGQLNRIPCFLSQCNG